MEKFDDIFIDDTRNVERVSSKEYLKKGEIAIVDQGKEKIIGYTNCKTYKVCKEERIIFGDHTRIFKYINVPFITGADGTKVLKIRDVSKYSYKYLYYYLLHSYIPDTGYNRHFKWIKELNFDVPIIDEQIKIANKLDKIQILIDIRKKQIEDLDELIKSQFVEMFENENRYVNLEDVCIFINGDRGKNYPSADKISKNSNGVPFINAGLLTNNTVDWENMNYISEETYNKLGAGKIQKDDILYCLRGSLGKHAIIDFDNKGAIASSLVILRANQNKIQPNFLLIQLGMDEIIRQQNQANNGSSQPNLSASSVKKYKIKLPNIEMQNKFVNIVKQIDKQKFEIQKSLEEIQKLQESLMNKYFGE